MKKCTWVYDEPWNFWETACGEAFTISDGSLEENKFRYCPFCGKLIKEAL